VANRADKPVRNSSWSSRRASRVLMVW